MPGLPPGGYAYLGPDGTFTEAALRTCRSRVGRTRSRTRRCLPRSTRWSATSTPRWCRWRTPSRAGSRPRWTRLRLASRWSSCVRSCSRSASPCSPGQGTPLGRSSRSRPSPTPSPGTWMVGGEPAGPVQPPSRPPPPGPRPLLRGRATRGRGAAAAERYGLELLAGDMHDGVGASLVRFGRSAGGSPAPADRRRPLLVGRVHRR